MQASSLRASSLRARTDILRAGVRLARILRGDFRLPEHEREVADVAREVGEGEVVGLDVAALEKRKAKPWSVSISPDFEKLLSP